MRSSFFHSNPILTIPRRSQALYLKVENHVELQKISKSEAYSPSRIEDCVRTTTICDTLQTCQGMEHLNGQRGTQGEDPSEIIQRQRGDQSGQPWTRISHGRVQIMDADKHWTQRGERAKKPRSQGPRAVAAMGLVSQKSDSLSIWLFIQMRI